MMFRRFAPLCAKSLARWPHPAATLHPRIAAEAEKADEAMPPGPRGGFDGSGTNGSDVGVHEPVVQTRIARAFVPCCPEACERLSDARVLFESHPPQPQLFKALNRRCLCLS